LSLNEGRDERSLPNYSLLEFTANQGRRLFQQTHHRKDPSWVRIVEPQQGSERLAHCPEGLLLLGPGFQCVDQLRREVLVPGENQLLFRIEVPEEGPPSDSQRLHDLIDRRIGETLFQEQVHAAARQLPAGGQFVLRTQACDFPGRHGMQCTKMALSVNVALGDTMALPESAPLPP